MLDPQQNRDFKGIWIPKDIWLSEDLSLIEKVLFAEIDSLDNENHCTASNEYFSKLCNCGTATVTRAISHLKELGLVEELPYNGRCRKLRVIKMISPTNQNDESDQSKRLPINISSNLDNNINTNTNVLVADAPRRNIPRDNSSAKKEPAKKKSRYEKCLDIIDELVDDTAIELKEKLKEYLQMRLNMRDKQIYANQWKSLVEKLLEMTDSNAERIKIVKQSLEFGWASFYELKSQSTYNKGNFTTVNGVRQNQDVFSEYGKVKSVREQEDNLANERF